MVFAAASELIGGTASVLVALGVLWRYVVRPVHRAWKRVSMEIEALHDIAQRELTHDGGSSLKDRVQRIDQTVDRLESETSGMRVRTSETHDAVESLAQVMDNIVDQKQVDHERLWAEIIRLGGQDPRRGKP